MDPPTSVDLSSLVTLLDNVSETEQDSVHHSMPQSYFRPIRRQSTVRNPTVRQRVNISKLPAFNPKLMTVRPLAVPKSQQDLHGSDRLINDIAPLRKRNPLWNSYRTGSIRPRVSVQSAFEPHARGAPGHRRVWVVEQIQIRISGAPDGVSGVALLDGDGVPVFLRCPVREVGYVEEPVSRLRDDRVDAVDLVVAKAQLRADDVRVGRAVDDHFRVRGALRKVTERSCMCDGQWFDERVVVDWHVLGVLEIPGPCGVVEVGSEFGDLACSLGFQIRLDCCIELVELAMRCGRCHES